MSDTWESGDAYERYVGRWSRVVASRFVDWLEVSEGARWADVGCGTGALTDAVLTRSAPASVVGVDPSPDFVATARNRVLHPAVTFEVGDALALDRPSRSFDAAVCGLVLNFLGDPVRGVEEMVRIVEPGGTVAAYVWDYAHGMELMRYFWDAAVELDPSAAALDEAARFPLCTPDGLTSLWRACGLGDVEATGIDVPTVFRDFDDFWAPFEEGQGPAPGYSASLAPDDRARLRDLLHERLPRDVDGSVHLTARAWAVKGAT